MGSSDSESECFESAEESFDEDEEEKNDKTKLKKNQRKSEQEASNIVVSDCHAVDSAETNTSSSSLSYRKRPERVKRSISRTQTKPVSKSPTNELVFKADKIVPDVFLQDITSNLSKNLNKSLSTLQQKSSNVKDLILNSLPVSCADESEGFCYDDKSIPVDDKNKMLSSEVGHPNNNQTVGSSKKENIKYDKEILKDEITNAESELAVAGNKSDNNAEKEPEENSTVDNCKTFNNDKENSEKNSESDTTKILPENSCTEAVNIVSYEKEEIMQDINNMNQENLEILAAEEENNTDTNKLGPVDFIEKTDPEIKICEKSEKLQNEIEVNVKVKEEEVLNEFLGSVEDENSENNPSLDICDENKFNNVIQDKNKVTTECNLEELKAALKNIVKEENICATENFVKEETICAAENVVKKENICATENFVKEESICGTENVIKEESLCGTENVIKEESLCGTENVIKEESLCGTENVIKEESLCGTENVMKEENIGAMENDELEGSKDVNENSGDGWDDFDFSDDENLNSSESCQGKKFEDVKINDELTKSKSPVADVKSCNKAEEKNVKETSTKSQAKKTILNVKQSKEVEKPKMVSQTNIVENDSWDWDSWDDIPENKEVEVTQTKKSEIKKQKDVSKWSGWDTFGQKQQEKQDNWGLGSWGVDALLNKATAVTQGISSVLEAGLGAPDPETLARLEKIERENSLEAVKNTEDEFPGEISKKNSLTNVNIFPVSGITSLVAGVTSKIVEHSKIQEIGSKVITGGLETLETFGKKTMEVLQEGDPGLKNKRALLLGNNKPVLSQVLKEAREKAERESKKVEEKELAKKCHFETLFDDFQGMVHLEALEMLSRQCEIKLEQIRSGMNSEEQEDLNGILEEVEQLCSLDDIEMKSSMLDFKTVMQMAVEPLKNEISVQNIVQIHADVCKWLQMSSETDPSFTVINQKLVSTLAELTAATVHQFHKSGELLSVKECRKTVEEVDALLRLTNALCTEINKLGEKFIKLSSNRTLKDASDNANSINEKVNDVMKNSVFYIKQAFNLLIPVIQLGAAV